MANIINLTGQKFGILVVLEQAGNRKNGQTVWLCRCECGNITKARSNSLRTGRTKSCGCKRGFNLPEGEANLNRLFYSYSDNATRRGIEFNIPKDAFKLITKQNCYYCGKAPSQIFGRDRQKNGVYIYNGIDRVDNRIGYTNDNCVACCTECNHKKRDITVEMARKIVEFIDGK